MFGKRRKQKELSEVFKRLFSIIDTDYEQFNKLYPIRKDFASKVEYELLHKEYGCVLGCCIDSNYHISVTGICNLISKILVDEQIEFIVDEERKFLKINFLKD